MKKIIAVLVALVLVGVGVYFLTRGGAPVPAPVDQGKPADQIATTTATSTVTVDDSRTVIATSVAGREVVAYHYGTGTKEILFVGGAHGGYSWNTAAVAYEAMDYLAQNPGVIPADVRVTVVPVLNPDGLYKVVGTTSPFAKSDVNPSADVRVAGRFNGHTVDLNRNFDCDWQQKAVWQDKSVSGGAAAFSEPESAGLKAYIAGHPITAAVVWYSAAGGVFASNCHDGVLPETTILTNVYAKASGYPAHEEFNFYEVTGDMVNWLAKEKIPAISVLLTTHEETEWAKNQKGIAAILSHFAD